MTIVDVPDPQPVEIALGLRAVAVNDPNVQNAQRDRIIDLNLKRQEPKLVVTFDEFCDLPVERVSFYFPPEDCDACNEVSTSLLASLFVTLDRFRRGEIAET